MPFDASRAAARLFSTRPDRSRPFPTTSTSTTTERCRRRSEQSRRWATDKVSCRIIPVVKDTTVSFKLDRSLNARLVALAKSENRSLSNFIENVLKEEIVRHESK